MATSSENSNCEIENLNAVPQGIQQSSCQVPGDENPVEHSHPIPSGEVEEKAPTIPEVAEVEVEEEEERREVTGKRMRDEKNEEDENADEEKGVLHPMWKTSLCSYYRRQSGSCSHGDACRYAHGEAELRPRPDNTWDPTSERAKKLLKSENGEKIETLEEDAREDVLVMDVLADSSDCSLRKCLVHLPRRWNSDNLKSFLDEQGVVYKTANKKKGMTVGFVTFETLEEVKNAIEGLNGKSMGNKHVKVADVIPRAFEKKSQSLLSVTQSTEQSEEAELADESAAYSAASKTRSARDVVTPLAHLPYSDQLENKRKSLEQTLKRLTRNARKACPDGIALPEWILKSKEIGGLPCRLEGIVESPLVDGYRNKCEFSVGFSTQGKITVGFMVGNFREGVTAVGEPIDCPNVSKTACKYANVFQEFLQQSSLPVWNRLNNTGYWRQLTVREGRNPSQSIDNEYIESNISEVMLIIQVCSVGFDDELTKSELQRMSEAFVQGANANSPPLPLTSLVVQDHQGISNAAPADAPLHPLPIPKAESAPGQEGENNSRELRIHDCISNLRFSISPTAFFQVNTLAAEKLYSLAGDWAGLGPDTLLFDICCGTGTIGLTLAHRVGMVIGIEMNASAVNDAQRNAEINGVKNCKFICAKAEEVVGSLLKEYHSLARKQEETLHVSQSSSKWETDEENGVSSSSLDHDESNAENVKSVSGSENIVEELKDASEKSCISENNGKTDDPNLQYKNVVAIVDPPRVGLHPIVIKALRTHSSLRRLVYISCNPDSLVANAIELCTPSSDKTEKGNKNNRGWRNMSTAGLARHRAKSMPNSEPFRPVKAMAVDLFPHTPHCEMVMLLER